ncbi:hypothetical protein XarbCFBP7610_11660 [Xanthomonas arboricola]|nr:hypothetical protein XarbCFBP7610_11660 [Xanthomonas arboricola]
MIFEVNFSVTWLAFERLWENLKYLRAISLGYSMYPPYPSHQNSSKHVISDNTFCPFSSLTLLY